MAKTTYIVEVIRRHACGKEIYTARSTWSSDGAFSMTASGYSAQEAREAFIKLIKATPEYWNNFAVRFTHGQPVEEIWVDFHDEMVPVLSSNAVMIKRSEATCLPAKERF